MKHPRFTIILFKGLLIIVLAIPIISLRSSLVLAQNPTNWQQTATGLSVNGNEEKKTAGLGIIVQAQNWPFLSLQGGVKDGGNGHTTDFAIGIQLGSVKIPGAQTVSLTNEVVDWTHNELTFTVDGTSQLKLWVSRLSPAILMQSSTNALRLLAGNVSGNVYDESQQPSWKIQPRPTSPAYPKYVAFQSGGNIQIRPLSTTELPLPPLEQNWLLLWYGDKSHFVETKVPLTGLPRHTDAYQADAPLLLVFENQPTTIKHSVEGGIDLSFATSAGYVSLLPLLGRDHLRVSETESWSQGLPTSISQKAMWWANHLCSYPINAAESYAYDSVTDTATITENISYLNVCSGSTSFAPIPPMLSLAKDPLGIIFSDTIVDPDLSTEFGPILGIENANQYTWSVTGLKKYADSTRDYGIGSVPQELEQELVSQVEKIINAGHFAPWLFFDGVDLGDRRGDLYWANPADTIYQLIQIAEALPDSALKNDLINYIKTERVTYPPEVIYDLDLPGRGAGVIRRNYSYDSYSDYSWTVIREDVHLEDVPLFSYFALSQYYDLTKESVSVSLLDKAKTVLDRDMSEQDWASFYWFKGYQDRRVAIINANRHFAGLVGFVRLAKRAGDNDAEEIGRALLAKAAVVRLGIAKYPRYLYTKNLVELPPQPAWQPQYISGIWYGTLFNYHWTGPFDDARQATTLDQFGIELWPHSGFGDFNYRLAPYLTAYRDMVPELARLLIDYAYEDSEVYVNKVEALFPHWYVAFAEGMLGNEHNLSHPIDSYQIFMAKAWIQQEPPDKLAIYTDIPWLEAGDLFYVHKLAETIKAYRGYTWVSP